MSPNTAHAGGSGEPVPLRLLITGRYVLARDGVAALVAQVDGVASATPVTDAALADACQTHAPDAVVLVLVAEPESGPILTQVARVVAAADPSPALVLMAPFRSALARILVTDGPQRVAYLSDRGVPDAAALARAARDAVDGIAILDARVLMAALGGGPDGGQERLTPREHDVLSELAEGKSNRAIAESLGISVKSVEANVTKVFRKLGLDDDDRYDRRVRAARMFAG